MEQPPSLGGTVYSIVERLLLGVGLYVSSRLPAAASRSAHIMDRAFFGYVIVFIPVLGIRLARHWFGDKLCEKCRAEEAAAEELARQLQLQAERKERALSIIRVFKKKRTRLQAKNATAEQLRRLRENEVHLLENGCRAHKRDIRRWLWEESNGLSSMDFLAQ